MEAVKPFVFVLMPFKKELQEIYEAVICLACEEVGAYCERADEDKSSGNIMNMIYKNIAKADIIISDMSEKNPNVYYETGYAHALGKTVILLINRKEDIPFDLGHYSHIIYGEMKKYEIIRDLENRLKWCFDNPKGSLAKTEFNLKLYLSGNDLEKKPTVKLNWMNISVQEKIVKLQIDVHNPLQTIQKGNFEIGIITPAEFDQNHFTGQIIDLPDKKKLHTPKNKIGSLYPDGWTSITLHLDSTEPSIGYQGGEYQIIVRVFTQLGTKDYPFTICLDPYQKAE